jgi:hypothetical protein
VGSQASAAGAAATAARPRIAPAATDILVLFFSLVIAFVSYGESYPACASA